MRTLLLLGGMTPDVTGLYYDITNRAARSALGGRHNAPLYVYSANLEAMVQYAGAGDWDNLVKAYTNPVDALSDKVDVVVSLSPTGVPLPHIADCVAVHLKSRYPQVRTVGLLEEVNRGMMNEVSKGAAAVTPQTKAMFIRQANKLIKRGAQGIILGSTDLGFVVRLENFDDGVIIIKLGAIHAEEAAKWALRN
ncbi:Asp/Glu/hydantoin racemase [Xylaria acuta]|nr:Asp/Glu/hydantoin racemase [Xylaria acuta]